MKLRLPGRLRDRLTTATIAYVSGTVAALAVGTGGATMLIRPASAPMSTPSPTDTVITSTSPYVPTAAPSTITPIVPTPFPTPFPTVAPFPTPFPTVAPVTPTPYVPTVDIVRGFAGGAGQSVAFYVSGPTALASWTDNSCSGTLMLWSQNGFSQTWDVLAGQASASVTPGTYLVTWRLSPDACQLMFTLSS